ncbi:1-acyl-sn-glycerol-3-phosphate acyltransferase [bacterium]|nr:1-acyl-sn-glycerol-3-phosphate acyltransferase [bacterium]
MRWHYRIILALAELMLRLFFRLKVKHWKKIPQRGGLLLASNHASFLDPPIIAVGVRHREIHFMARSTLFKRGGFGRIISSVNAHPVVRGQGPNQDWELFKEVLKSGGSLLVFPEGTRTKNGELQRGKTGFAKLAYMSKMPVYPAYIHHSYEAWPKGGRIRCRPIRVIFGDQVEMGDLYAQPEEKSVLREISQRVMNAISGLKKEIQEEVG